MAARSAQLIVRAQFRKASVACAGRGRTPRDLGAARARGAAERCVTSCSTIASSTGKIPAEEAMVMCSVGPGAMRGWKRAACGAQTTTRSVTSRSVSSINKPSTPTMPQCSQEGPGSSIGLLNHSRKCGSLGGGGGGAPLRKNAGGIASSSSFNLAAIPYYLPVERAEQATWASLLQQADRLLRPVHLRPLQVSVSCNWNAYCPGRIPCVRQVDLPGTTSVLTSQVQDRRIGVLSVDPGGLLRHGRRAATAGLLLTSAAAGIRVAHAALLTVMHQFLRLPHGSGGR
jgi:hypothetical protein